MFGSGCGDAGHINPNLPDTGVGGPTGNTGPTGPPGDPEAVSLRRSEAERWLLQAENDLAFTAEGLRLGYTAQTCFMAQQSAEKAAKALHYHRGARVVLGHSVDALLAQAGRPLVW